MHRRYKISLPRDFDVTQVSGASFRLGAYAGDSSWHLLSDDDSLDFVGKNDLVIVFRPDFDPADFEEWQVFGPEWAEELLNAKYWFAGDEGASDV